MTRGGFYRPSTPPAPSAAPLAQVLWGGGGTVGGPKTIHLDCGSGWCASQGTPDRDCGDGRSAACSPNPAGFGPQGVPPPTFCPSILPLGRSTPGRGAPRCPATPPPFKPVASQGVCSTANLETRLWAGGGEVLLEAREY